MAILKEILYSKFQRNGSPICTETRGHEKKIALND